MVFYQNPPVYLREPAGFDNDGQGVSNSMVFQKKKKPGSQEPPEKQFRSKTNPLLFAGTIIFLAIVIFSFVFVPAIVPQVGAGGDLTFGYYDKVPITYVPGNYFAQVQENITQYMRAALDDTNAQSVYYQIWRSAFEETVVHTAILQEMKKAGYTAPEETVDRMVAQLPQFQENGRFSAQRYRQLDSQTRISLWREVQDSIAEEHYREDMTGLRVASGEAAFAAAMASPQRSFEMVAFPLSGYPDEEITRYAAANPALFMVTQLSRITISSSEREAQQVLSSVQDGTLTFEDAARTHSQDSYAERGGDMGLKMVYELTSEIPETADREAVAALRGGEYSALLKVPAGWAFFRAEVSPYPADTGDSSLLSKLRSYMLTFERGQMEDWLIAQAEEFSALVRETDFTSAALAKGLEKSGFGPLPLNYGGVDLFTALSAFSVQELTYAGSNELFWRTAFSTPVNTPSSPLVISNSVLVLFPLEETPADDSTREMVESAYASYWLSYNAERSLRSSFLGSKNLRDQFIDTFLRIYAPLTESGL